MGGKGGEGNEKILPLDDTMGSAHLPSLPATPTQYYRMLITYVHAYIHSYIHTAYYSEGEGLCTTGRSLIVSFTIKHFTKLAHYVHCRIVCIISPWCIIRPPLFSSKFLYRYRTLIYYGKFVYKPTPCSELMHGRSPMGL